MAMKCKVIKVGNSKGIIIPNKFIPDINVGETIEIIIKNSKIREGWRDQFKKDSNRNHE